MAKSSFDSIIMYGTIGVKAVIASLVSAVPLFFLLMWMMTNLGFLTSIILYVPISVVISGIVMNKVWGWK